MAGYEYNPILKLDLQKKSAVSPSDIEHLEQEIASINEDITDINGDLKNKVPKFFTSIEELEIGEIGEYQGETNETFTRGYFYQRNNSLPVVYEDVTIPIGSQKIIYTNKFDSSQKIVYSFDTITLDNSVTINYGQSGYAWQLTAAMHDDIAQHGDSNTIDNAESLIPDELYYLYTQFETIRGLSLSLGADQYYRGTIDVVQSLFDVIQQTKLYVGFRVDTESPAIIGTLYDLCVQVVIPISYTYGSNTQYSQSGKFLFLRDLLAFNWDFKEYVSRWYPTEIIEGKWCYDETHDTLFMFDLAYFLFNANDSVYVLKPSTAAAQTVRDMYHLVSEDGKEERFVKNNLLECVFDSTPVPSSSYWAQALDLDIYFNYTAEIVETSEPITIHKKKQYYDEYGFPLVDTPAIERVDTQPAIDPTQFATAEQGVKADTALQGITHGTDGNYVTSNIGAKDANNEQSVSVSLKLQPISTAGSGAKGLAEASDVKEYIGNNTATHSQGTKADNALQEIVRGTDGQFVTTTVTQKVNNAQTIYTALTFQGIATADAQHQGVAEASDVRNYLNIIAATSEAYGVMWDTANPSPTLTRIGNMTNHALLPVQSQMIGGVMADDGTFTPFDNQADWTQATQARDGSDGQVMVRIPKHWRICSTFGTYNIVMLSPVEIPGYDEVREQYVSAYEASLQRSTLKLSSVNNATADYRGGQNEASWDGSYRTLLNRPVSNIDLTEFRTYARNRAAGTSWNCLTYEAVRTIFWSFAVEYATLNSQADYTSELDANGYHQGGLGIGVSDWNGDAWYSFNVYAPLIPCGVLDEYGSGTAVKNFSIYNADTTLAHTFQCNKYRGIEMPFGHIWKHTDGVLINVEANPGVSTAYVTTDTAYFSSTSIADYSAICNTYRIDSYIKGIVFNADGDIFATTSGGNSTSYYCDHYWGANVLSSGSQLRAWLFGGAAYLGALCGLACSNSHNGVGYRARYLGSRLCFVP